MQATSVITIILQKQKVPDCQSLDIKVVTSTPTDWIFYISKSANLTKLW